MSLVQIPRKKQIPINRNIYSYDYCVHIRVALRGRLSADTVQGFGAPSCFRDEGPVRLLCSLEARNSCGLLLRLCETLSEVFDLFLRALK